MRRESERSVSRASNSNCCRGRELWCMACSHPQRVLDEYHGILTIVGTSKRRQKEQNQLDCYIVRTPQE